MVIELEEKFKLRKAEIFATIKKYVTEAKMDISDTVIENLSIHLALSITRELSGSYIEMSSSQIEQLKQANTYQISQLIIYDLSKKYDVRISEDDICYCAMYLSNMTLLDLEPRPRMPLSVMKSPIVYSSAYWPSCFFGS